MKRLAFLIISTFLLWSCENEAELMWTIDPSGLQPNIWTVQKGTVWSQFTTVASNNEVAYYVGNDVYIHNGSGVINLRSYPEREVRDKFAHVTPDGTLITGGGVFEDGRKSTKVYHISSTGTITWSGTIPQYGGSPNVFGMGDTLVTSIYANIDGRGMAEHISFWDKRFTLMKQIKLPSYKSLQSVFKYEGKYYFVFENGLLELSGGELIVARNPSLNFATYFGTSAPKVVYTSDKIAVGWPDRIVNNIYQPFEKMIVYRTTSSESVYDAPGLCDPEVYFLKNILYIVGGKTGNVNNPSFNTDTHCLLLRLDPVTWQ